MLPAIDGCCTNVTYEHVDPNAVNRAECLMSWYLCVGASVTRESRYPSIACLIETMMPRMPRLNGFLGYWSRLVEELESTRKEQCIDHKCLDHIHAARCLEAVDTRRASQPRSA